jgi:hypothetical protein
VVATHGDGHPHGALLLEVGELRRWR